MSNDTEQQMRHDLEICEFFSLQLGGSTNVSDLSQLLVFIRMVFNNGNIKELLKIIPLHGKTRGEDIFRSFHASLLKMNVPIHKLVSITTDGAPAMTNENVGLTGLCKKDPAFPDFFSYHCVIHWQALCTKVIDFQHMMSVQKNCKLKPC
jgi:hypothetical protein